MIESDAKPADAVPTAQVRRARRWTWVWIVPVIAVVFAGFLAYTHVIRRGPVIKVRFADGFGIKPGDALRCRGIEVGRVESVVLNEQLNGVVLHVRLEETAGDLARAGSRFWIVRPELSLSAVRGLETITGPRYIAVLPGDGAEQQMFIGLDDSPIVSLVEPDGLEVTLYAERRGSVVRGAPILYRQIQIGTVLSVGLASDASSVEVRAYITPMYRELVRDNSKFWNVSGADLALGWSGLRFEVESMQSLLEGGVAMATPNGPGKAVSTGHRFALHDRPEEQWLAWRPSLVVGSAMLPEGAAPPTMLRATALRTGGRLWESTTQIKGWLLLLPDGLLGPGNMLAPMSPDANETAALLELGGERLELKDEPVWQSGGLALLTAPQGVGSPWPYTRVRVADKPEDCLIFTDSATPAMPVDASRIERRDGRLLIDSTVSFDRNLHGAAVLGRSDGKLIGMLLVDRGRGEIARPHVPEAAKEAKAATPANNAP